jgi:hypothetical protein
VVRARLVRFALRLPPGATAPAIADWLPTVEIGGFPSVFAVLRLSYVNLTCSFRLVPSGPVLCSACLEQVAT